MGDEIHNCVFSDEDTQEYFKKLHAETELLKTWFANGRFTDDTAMGGIEQEAWIIDQEYRPSPENQYLIETLQSEFLSPELAKFNIELNVTPQILQADGLRKIHTELAQLWAKCEKVLEPKALRLQMIGILPTVCDDDLVVGNMSSMNRYAALNEQILKSRQGKPLQLDIVGKEHLCRTHADVMLESAATSFQIHRQIPLSQAVRYYNAAIFLSAPMVAIGANSPSLFGKNLWDETRIPLFEQAVEVGGYGHAIAGPIRRVSFGSGYARKSMFECFIENIVHYPILLPELLLDPVEKLSHLRLHNGTIWRWNRPLIGFNQHNVPHLRVEHRVVSAGPTIADEMANTAFFYGLQEYYANCVDVPEDILEFAHAKTNFYLAAQHGLSAKVTWLGSKSVKLNHLILDELCDKAKLGLEKLSIDKKDIDYYLGIIRARASNQQNGSSWQRRFIEKHGKDQQELAAQYWENQRSEKPVHEWII